MLKVECSRKEVAGFFILVIALDLLFIVSNCPLIPGSLTEPITAFTLNPIRAFIRFQLDLKREGVVATWYSSILLFAAGAVALLNTQAGHTTGWRKWLDRAGWLLMGSVLIGLSADEVAQIHESLARLSNLIAGGATHREAGDWIPMLLPFIIAVALFMMFFFALVVREDLVSMILSLAGLAFWSCAIVSEAVEAGIWRVEMSYQTRGFIEESCEVIGTTLLLFAFILFYRRRSGPVTES